MVVDSPAVTVTIAAAPAPVNPKLSISPSTAQPPYTLVTQTFTGGTPNGTAEIFVNGADIGSIQLDSTGSVTRQAANGPSPGTYTVSYRDNTSGVGSNGVTLTVSAYTLSTPTVSPTSLPYTGGNVTVSGTTTYPDGTTLSIKVNGSVVGSASVLAGAYSGTIAIVANSTQSPVSDTIVVEGP